MLPLDVFRAMDGFILLVPIVADGPGRERLALLSTKCPLLAARILQQCSEDDLWKTGRQLLGVDISETIIWCVWVEEVIARRAALESRAQRGVSARKRIAKQ